MFRSLIAVMAALMLAAPDAGSAQTPAGVTVGLLSDSHFPFAGCVSRNPSPGTATVEEKVKPQDGMPTQGIQREESGPLGSLFKSWGTAPGVFRPFGQPPQGAQKATSPAAPQAGPTCFYPRPRTLEFRLIEAGSDYKTRFVIRVMQGPDLDGAASALAKEKVAMIISLGTAATVAASRASQAIPIVMVGVSDPVRLGLVTSLARPSGNVTGISFLGPELAQKGLELLLQVSPRPSQVAVLWNPENPGAAIILRGIEINVQALGIRIVPIEARTTEDVPRALERASSAQADGLMVLADRSFGAARELIAEFAQQHKIPTVFQLREYVDAGGLLSYGPAEEDFYGLTTSYMMKILKGASPADLPIEQPSRFHFVINLKTAKTLGLTIPPSLLQRADQVIDP